MTRCRYATATARRRVYGRYLSPWARSAAAWIVGSDRRVAAAQTFRNRRASVTRYRRAVTVFLSKADSIRLVRRRRRRADRWRGQAAADYAFEETLYFLSYAENDAIVHFLWLGVTFFTETASTNRVEIRPLSVILRVEYSADTSYLIMSLYLTESPL